MIQDRSHLLTMQTHLITMLSVLVINVIGIIVIVVHAKGQWLHGQVM